MKNKIIFSCFCLLLIAFASCRKDNSFSQKTETPIDPIVTIWAKAKGFVTDENGDPIADAQVTLGNTTTSTDTFGFFQIADFANSERAILHVDFDGYFEAFHTFIPIRDDIARTTIQLMPEFSSAQFNASQGGTVSIAGGKVIFQPNSFTDDQGNPYVGTVSIFATYLDPTRADIKAIMPGDYSALNVDNELRWLQSFGMLNVHLVGDAGTALQINQPATIEIDVPNELLSEAPNEIPLWYFDENQGLWKEEGTAQLQGQTYSGEVNHFTFWGCGASVEMVELSGVVEVGNYTPNILVKVELVDDWGSAQTHTSENGVFLGKVPKDYNLDLTLWDYCGNVVHTQNLGALPDDTDIGTINLSINGSSWAEVEGTVVDCQMNEVDNGYVLLKLINPNRLFGIPTQSDGSVKGLIPSCGANEVIAIATDYTSEKVSEPKTFSVSSFIDMGTLEACPNPLVPLVVVNYGTTELTFDAGCTVDITYMGDTTIYEFTFLDQQPNGSAEIKAIYWDLNADPTNPELIYKEGQCLILSGTLDVHYEIFGGNDIQLEQHGTQPGEFVVLNIPSGVSVTENMNMVALGTASMRLQGVIN
ncbi:MAG: hypothetical protein AAF573_04440 [Bacteroidota bacterium]